MRKTLKSAFLATLLALGTAHADDEYVGLSLTKPLGKEGFGLQLVLRRDNLEVRAGADSHERYQLGGGLTAGGNTTASAGFALSNYHSSLVPYVGAATEVYGDWEVGAVSYADLPYVTIGKRLGDDDDKSDSRRAASSAGGGSGSGDSGSGDSGDNPDDGDDSGSDSGGSGGGSNHSGQGDGTNPGNTDQNNGGTNNPGGSS